MVYMGNLKKGDRVRVTIEADVKHGSSFGVDLAVGDGTVTILEESFPGVGFEKVEPPVEVFKPGDVVRNKNKGDVVVLDTKGYTYITSRYTQGRRFEYAQGYQEGDFTSERFERVSLDSLA